MSSLGSRRLLHVPNSYISFGAPLASSLKGVIEKNLAAWGPHGSLTLVRLLRQTLGSYNFVHQIPPTE